MTHDPIGLDICDDCGDHILDGYCLCIFFDPSSASLQAQAQAWQKAGFAAADFRQAQLVLHSCFDGTDVDECHDAAEEAFFIRRALEEMS